MNINGSCSNLDEYAQFNNIDIVGKLGLSCVLSIPIYEICQFSR